jgi:hypothetical protein
MARFGLDFLAVEQCKEGADANCYQDEQDAGSDAKDAKDLHEIFLGKKMG